MSNKTFSSSSKIIQNMLSRKERVKQVRAQLEKDWHDKWWAFMMEFEAELDWTNMSANPNITMKDVLENPDKPWNWFDISGNPNITMKDILENLDKP